MENQVQVDFESDVLNYSLGPITWNSESIKGTRIAWDTFLHALYIQSDTDSHSKFPLTSSLPCFLTTQVPVISPWMYLWPVFLRIHCWDNLCLISEPKFPFRCVIYLFFYFIFNLRTAAFKTYCAIWVRRSNFRHQASPRVPSGESTQQWKVELWARNVREFCLLPKMPTSTLHLGIFYMP